MKPIKLDEHPLADIKPPAEAIAAIIRTKNVDLRDAAYFSGRDEGFRGLAFYLDEAKTPARVFVRHKIVLDYLAGFAGDVDQLARECGVTPRTIYNERERLLAFIKTVEIS